MVNDLISIAMLLENIIGCLVNHHGGIEFLAKTCNVFHDVGKGKLSPKYREFNIGLENLYQTLKEAEEEEQILQEEKKKAKNQEWQSMLAEIDHLAHQIKKHS